MSPGAIQAQTPYRPYGFDLGFLPAPIRYAKDYLRCALHAQSSRIGAGPAGPAWNRFAIERHAELLRRSGRLFIHIPKTGGTSISRVLYGRNLPHFTASFYRRHAPDLFAGVTSFAVIRDPVSRALSAWRFLHGGGSDHVRCNLHERARLRADQSFEDFVERLADCELTRLPNTVWEQSYFVLDEAGGVLVDRLFAWAPHGANAALDDWLGGRAPPLNTSEPFEAPVRGQVVRRLERLYARDFELHARILSAGGAADARGWDIGG